VKFEDASCFIAILDYPYIEKECTASLLGMYEYSKWLCPGKRYPRNEIELCFVDGTSPARAHNKAVHEFLDDPREFKRLLIVGRDHIFKSDALKILFEADKDIIAGITVARQKAMSQVKDPVLSIVSDWKDGKPVNLTRIECIEKINAEKGQPFKVPVIGDGLMMVKRKVFERMPAPWFYEPPITEEERKEMGKKVLGTIGCDIIFCREALKYGFETWAHPGVQYVHIGKHYAAVAYNMD
jgi:hypothetical protein